MRQVLAALLLAVPLASAFTSSPVYDDRMSSFMIYSTYDSADKPLQNINFMYQTIAHA
jgi:hypothetical protein